MSRHEGVSCDSCLKGNFRGRRFKCLICYDYDLCEVCYEGGATNTRHTTDHPMQCILTRSDFELFYGGEALTNADQPQSFTCPYCSRMGFTDVTLQDHVTSEHADTSFEVVCPLCAAMPGGDPNLMTDDFAGHLTLEHRTGPRDLISFLDEPVSTRHSAVRRIPHSAHLSGGRGGQSSRPRRSNMHFSVFSSSGLTSLSPSSRESVDPIAELLSQLSGVRRSASNTNSTPSQLQQLQMQLQLERQQHVSQATRQQLERLPRRQNQSQNTVRETTSSSPGYSLLMNPSGASSQPSSSAPQPINTGSSYLLDGLMEELAAQSSAEGRDPRMVEFIEELTYSSLARGFETLGFPERPEKGRSTPLSSFRTMAMTHRPLNTNFAAGSSQVQGLQLNVAQEGSSQGAALSGGVLQGNVSKGGAFKRSSSQGGSSQGCLSQGGTSKGSLSQECASQGCASQGGASQGCESQGGTSQGNASQAGASQTAPSQVGAACDASQVNASKVAPQTDASQVASQVSSQMASQVDATQIGLQVDGLEDASQMDALQNASQEDASQEEGSQEDASQVDSGNRVHSGVFRLRGRARSDGLNANRRAEANKATVENKGDDNTTKTDISR